MPTDRACNVGPVLDWAGIGIIIPMEAGGFGVTRLKLGKTIAHEIGHYIMCIEHPLPWSLTHKGTSDVWQSKTDDTPSYPADPAEIDVCKYYMGVLDDPDYDRVKLDEGDAIRLISDIKIEIESD